MSAEPSRRLSGYAPWVWRLHQVLLWGALLVAGMFAAGPLDGTLALLVRVVPLVGLVAGTAIVPTLRWRRWRWVRAARQACRRCRAR